MKNIMAYYARAYLAVRRDLTKTDIEGVDFHGASEDCVHRG